jgi:hypothetical protein
MKNPFHEIKKFINRSADAASQSFDKVSTDVSQAVTPIVQNVKPDTKPDTKPVVKPVVKPVETSEDKSNYLVPFEKQYESMYIGCYSDEPSNPSMDTFLGQASNISECINMGRENNFEYIGLRGGNECFASNTIPTTQSVDRIKYCNVGCDDVGTGNCGGFFYNQVYKTTIPNDMPKLNNSDDSNNNSHKSEQELHNLNPIDILENFISSDNDMKKITMGLNINNFNCWKPLNTYVIFFWLVVLIFLIYLLFEYLYKKNRENII